VRHGGSRQNALSSERKHASHDKSWGACRSGEIMGKGSVALDGSGIQGGHYGRDSGLLVKGAHSELRVRTSQWPLPDTQRGRGS